MRITLTGRTLAAALAVFVLAVGGGVAYANIPDRDGIYDACLSTAGTLRLIDSEAGQECRRGETPISWSQGARLACPDGMIMSTGVCIETSARAADIRPDAEDDCADEGRRLPSPGELKTARVLEEIDLGNGEWTDDVADINRIDQSTGEPFGDFSIAAVSERGSGVEQAFDPQPYRCVTGPGIG